MGLRSSQLGARARQTDPSQPLMSRQREVAGGVCMHVPATSGTVTGWVAAGLLWLGPEHPQPPAEVALSSLSSLRSS